MPKTRPYSREELQGLRRADLQRLCKTYDIKGANAKSEVLVETLATYFTSPAYLSSPPPDRRRPRPRPVPIKVPARAPPTATRPLKAIPQRSAKPDTARPKDVSGPLPVPSSSTTTEHPARSPPVDSTNTPVDGTGDADLAALRCQVARIDATISNWKREQATLIDRAVESRVSAELEAAVKRQFALIEQREEAVKRREEQLDAAWKRLEQRLAKVSNTASPTSRPSSPPATGEKRRRIDTTHSANKRTRLLETPLAGSSQLPPRTPSPNQEQTWSRRFATPPGPFGGPPGEQPSPTTRSHPMPLGSGPSRSDKASKAHLELATATKDSVFGPILGNTVTPPALSPSPSISGDHSYVAVSTGSQSRANQTQRGRVFPSPRREYMDIALNGLTGESPSAMATPSSRTLLGTERYRDTRFGDEPFVAWSLPSVDYDSANL